MEHSIYDLLKSMFDKGASDLHITTGSPPQVRVRGQLYPLDAPVMDPKTTRELLYSILTESQKHKFEEEQELDLSFGIKGVARFRANIFIQRGALAGVFRMIPYEIMALDSLGLPPVVMRLTTLPRGLILVTGPTGCGKSTTLAAFLDKINTERHDHIVTIEDPIEFVHKHKGCLVNQREIGADTKSFVNALKYILRQDPDVVFIGEMRDLETMQAALTISETGHLVFATLHTNSAVQTVNRIVDAFPAHQQSQIRAQLAFVLEAVIAQQLIPRLDGKGRVMSSEVMISTPAIRNLIREDKIHQIYSQMQVGQTKHGMQTMNQSLLNLYMRKFVSLDDALGRSMDPEELRQMMSSPSQQRNVSGTERR
ncbi:MAG TPA: type IV pilus twitching motility protein PilT [Deltaproteobacteria bacterium]|nr:MAG: Twitching mobility protein [Deltaproteobacteria bacterium ADurb.Bin072]HNQ84781.1 type IV pilus twitching motility protein PilT [Deltaproteobacteria bacterium]HRW79279.1 type IV pilus twitching motility protein PilT [Desulfomonilia bacterium]HNS89585.1 type IV pilus twitching motility protein PilT [Deltaproteobacteria bacterium]HOA44136.1 type IV pilus twitching motility protein PilT [Deltaproteobacteria bacterium]